MQAPLEGISFNFVLSVMPSNAARASVPASIAESINEGDSVDGNAWRLFSTETLELDSQVLDLKFDQKFASFKKTRCSLLILRLCLLRSFTKYFIIVSG